MAEPICRHLIVEKPQPAAAEEKGWQHWWAWQMVPWLAAFSATFAWRMYKARADKETKLK
jgi:hypothetical protein